MTKIAPHTCYSPQQDQRYGVGLRLFNQMGDARFRCTVCGSPACDKLVKIRTNASIIQQSGGQPLRPGVWTCLGIA